MRRSTAAYLADVEAVSSIAQRDVPTLREECCSALWGQVADEE